MKSMDFLFYAGYWRDKDRFNGYVMVVLCGLVLSLGVMSLFAALGVDLYATLNQIYPFDSSDYVRSPFNKKSGAAVLFGFPFGLLFCWAQFRRGRAKIVIDRYDALRVGVSTFLCVLYIAGLVVGLFLAAMAFRTHASAFSLPAQLIWLALFEFVVVDRIIDGAQRRK